MDYNTWIYPGGEVGVRLDEGLIWNQTFRIQNSNDFMAMCMALNANKHHTKDILNTITIPYLPYARQDRVAVAGDPLATEVIAGILQVMGITNVFTFDLHSNITVNTFRSKNISLFSKSPISYIKMFLKDINEQHIYLVSPDKGATEKTKYYLNSLKVDFNVVEIIQCGKQRDPNTGKITNFNVEVGPNVIDKNASFVILDDICDGGYTFIGVADALKQKYGNHNSYLFTTHGIYSKGIDTLLNSFKMLGTTDTFITQHTHENLKKYNITIKTQADA